MLLDEPDNYLNELRRRGDEEHAKLKALVLMYQQKAAYGSSTGVTRTGLGRPTRTPAGSSTDTNWRTAQSC